MAAQITIGDFLPHPHHHPHSRRVVQSLGQPPRVRNLGLPVQGCQQITICDQEVSVPFGITSDEFESLIHDYETEVPHLSGDYTWHCANLVIDNVVDDRRRPGGKFIALKMCKHENSAPRFLLDSYTDVDLPETVLKCDSCGLDGLKVTTCKYPSCWWKLFNRIGSSCHTQDFCAYHMENDPEHIMDVITNSATDGYHCDGQPIRAGGQTFLNECENLDDYDLELESYLGIDKIVNETILE
jgi:hypothetical protein